MPRGGARTKAIIAALLLLAAAPARAGTLEQESNLLKDVAIEQKPGAQVPVDLRFADEDGNEVRLGDYFGDKPIILHLVYFECPMLCNVSSDSLIRTLRTMAFDVGEEFTVLTVSFDPRETPRLAGKAKRTAVQRYGRDGAERGWHFLTGRQPEIERLTDAVGFRYAWNERLGQYAHGATLVILTPEGQVSRYINGVEYAGRDIRFSLIEASENRIGNIMDQAMLICYPYDPRTGRYGLAINRLLQVSGVSTATILFGWIGLAIRREHRKRNARGAGQRPAREGNQTTRREDQEVGQA